MAATARTLFPGWLAFGRRAYWRDLVLLIFRILYPSVHVPQGGG
jgi:hypothetical protein